MAAALTRKAARPAPGGRVVEVVKRLRWALPMGIFGIVVLHQFWLATGHADWSPLRRFGSGLLFYGIVGPAVTYWTLDWIARALEAREAIEAQVRRGERTLASITSGSADAIFSLDQAERVQSWNRGAEAIFGYAAAEILGRPVAELVPEALQRRGDLAVIRERLLSEGFVRAYRTRRLARDGREVDVELTQTLLRAEDGSITGSSVILRDISNQIAAEAAVRRVNRELEDRVAQRTRELEAASTALREKNAALTAANRELRQLDAMKDEFVGLVSHELRAPLTNINASVELLLLGQPADGTREKLEIIGQEAQRLTRLVQGVLDVSRMQAGRLELQPAPVDAAALCQAALERLGPSGRECRLQAEPGTPPVLADPDRAIQVLGNLLSNALKYSPPGSRIDIAVGPAPEPGAVRFAVADRGAGIAAEELEPIFERFHRVERHDARATYGHGLGLYISRKIVEAHGGRIWAERRPGGGSIFYFTLPAAAEEP